MVKGINEQNLLEPDILTELQVFPPSRLSALIVDVTPNCNSGILLVYMNKTAITTRYL